MAKKIDFSPIDEEIRRLQDLKRFMADPRSLSLIKKAIGANGNGTEKPAQQSLVTAHITGQSTVTASGTASTGRNALLIAAEKGCKSFAQKIFTAYDLIKEMESNGYVFQAQDKVIAVNGVIRRLVAKGVIERVAEPSSGKPAQYRLLSGLPG